MKFSDSTKPIKLLFWCLYLPIGLWASQNIGISWDEGIELYTYNVNLAAILGTIQGNLTPYQFLLTYGDRYYGVGFHLPANAISALIQIFIPTSKVMEAEAYRITLNHIAIFLSFAASGFLVSQILRRLTKDEWVATLGMIAYLLWPYLLGHGLMNIKDVPFLFAWLLCTNQIIKIALEPKCNTSAIAFLLLGIFTGWLISIRISGILIAIEYGIFLGLFWKPLKNSFAISNGVHKKSFSIWKALGIFGLSSSLILYLLYPILWHNPLEILNAITYMSHHPWDGDTLTAGRFLTSKQLHWYIGTWLAVKLPLIALIGLTLSPLALYYVAIKGRGSSRALISVIGLLLSVLLILLALITHQVSLYNELRQVLFLFPLLWVIAITSLYWVNRKIVITLLLSSIAIFTWDNLRLFPYHYVYFNEVARQFPIAHQFEKDYFGLSATQGAHWLNQSPLLPTKDCLYASPLHLWQYAIERDKIYCVLDFGDRPQRSLNFPSNANLNYFIGIPVRDKIGLLPIPHCQLIHSEKRTLPLSSQTLVMNEIYQCRQ